ncbi:MAG: hypothetical protein IH891_07855, partial [Planctomycetes bacterium]|nr:hypothetical protein [Planctomycetota bacterium]
MTRHQTWRGAAALLIGFLLALPAAATDDVMSVDPELERPSELIVTLPDMDAARGRVLFAT